MTILQVVKDAAPKLGISTPAQLIADTGETSLELQKTLKEVAASISERHDWSVLKTLGTLTGDAVATTFNFPADYARMLKVARLWPSTTPWNPLTHYVDSDQWLGLVVQSFSPLIGGWTILGGQIAIRMGGSSAALALAATVQFYYISGNSFVDVGNTPKATITADDDSFRLLGPTAALRASGERLLKLGLIAKWKQDKGRAFAQDLSDFEDAMAVAIGNDKGSKPLVMSSRRTMGSYQAAFPGVIIPPP